nr:retrovirus-related Pol polyprotein from transposon TNT 1-94 [Tanacetum cinerariifolium]
MSTQKDINAIRAQRLANTHDPLALMANTQTPFHPYQSSHITYIQHPQTNNNFIQQPLFNTNYMPQPMQNPKDGLDPTTVMNVTLALLAKAFKVNTIPTNNNQRSSLIPYNSQIAQLGMNTSQDIKMKMVDNNVRNQRLSVVLKIANQYGNGNVETTPAKGNGNGIDGIQSTQEEFEFMVVAIAYEETERVKVNCTSKDTLQQASISRTQSDNAPVYDLDGSTEIEQLQAQLGDLNGKSSDIQCASNTLGTLSQKLKDENMSLESQNIRAKIFSIHSDDGNPSLANIKQALDLKSLRGSKGKKKLNSGKVNVVDNGGDEFLLIKTLMDGILREEKPMWVLDNASSSYIFSDRAMFKTLNGNGQFGKIKAARNILSLGVLTSRGEALQRRTYYEGNKGKMKIKKRVHI